MIKVSLIVLAVFAVLWIVFVVAGSAGDDHGRGRTINPSGPAG